MREQRLKWIDKMRGVAILSVVIQHLIGVPERGLVFLQIIAMVNMGIFFFISGYIWSTIYKKKQIGIIFLLKKGCELLIPFIVWSIVCRHYFFVSFSEWTLITWQELFHEFMHPTLWFLLTLFIFSVVFYGNMQIYRFCRKDFSQFFQMAFFLIILIMFFIIWSKTGLFKNETLYLPYFVIGVLMSQMSNDRLLTNAFSRVGGVLLLILLSMNWTAGSTSIMNVFIKIMVTSASIVLVYVMCTQFIWNGVLERTICVCGKHSLAIYVLHWFFLSDYPYLNTSNELIRFICAVIPALIISFSCVGIWRIITISPLAELLLFGNYKNLITPKNV